MLESRLVSLAKSLLAKKVFYRAHVLLHSLSLHGLGINNGENSTCSGEEHFLQTLCRLRRGQAFTALDVGAFVGGYAARLRELHGQARVFAFEPHPQSFRRMSRQAAQSGFSAVHAACSAKKGSARIYDYQGKGGSQHASLYSEVIHSLHQGRLAFWDVKQVRLDDFAREKKLDQIHLLKVDTEGNELEVLKGAAGLLKAGRVDVIHFEFNQMNVISRTFFRDFFETLKGYRLFRLLPDGLAPLPSYQPALCEIYGYQNIAALRQGLDWWPRA